MLGFLDFLTSREKAVLLWALVLLAFALTQNGREILGGFASLARFLASSWKLLVLFGSLAGWVALPLLAAHEWGGPHVSVLKEAVYWYFGTGAVLAGRTSEATRDPHFVRNVARRVLGVGFLAILVEFFAGLYTFSFAVEVVLVFVVSSLVLAVAAARGPEQDQVARHLNGCLTTIGATVLLVASFQAVTNPTELFRRENLEALLVSPALTLWVIPFLYGWGLIVGYEQVFVRVTFFAEKNAEYPRGVRWAVFRACGIRLARLRRFSQNFIPKLHRLGSQTDVEEMISEFHENERRSTDGASH